MKEATQTPGQYDPQAGYSDPNYNKPFRRTRRNLKRVWQAVNLQLHGVLWRTLFLLGVGRKLQIWMCKTGRYQKFPDGRCMWCGNTH